MRAGDVGVIVMTPAWFGFRQRSHPFGLPSRKISVQLWMGALFLMTLTKDMFL